METLTGRELDMAIARLLGEDKPPSRDYAVARVGARYVVSTGPVFTLEPGDLLPVPDGETLPAPEGSEDWNDRYMLYVGRFLTEKYPEIAAQVEAYRMKPAKYSSDPAAALQLLNWVSEQFWCLRVKVGGYPNRPDKYVVIMFTDEDGGGKAQAWEESLPAAIAQAVYAALMARQAEEQKR